MHSLAGKILQMILWLFTVYNLINQSIISPLFIIIIIIIIIIIYLF